MGLLDGLLGARSNRVPAKRGFRDTVSVADGDAPFNTAAEVFALVGAVGNWWRIWEATIPAQQEWSWGFGSPAYPDNQGYVFFTLGLAATGFDIGTVRLIIENANRTQTIPVASFSDTMTHSVTATTLITMRLIDRNQMIALPEKVEFPTVHEDSRIAINYYPTTLVAEDTAEFVIPVTKYY